MLRRPLQAQTPQQIARRLARQPMHLAQQMATAQEDLSRQLVDIEARIGEMRLHRPPQTSEEVALAVRQHGLGQLRPRDGDRAPLKVERQRHPALGAGELEHILQKRRERRLDLRSGIEGSHSYRKTRSRPLDLVTVGNLTPTVKAWHRAGP
jgi:hypothetical protein